MFLARIHNTQKDDDCNNSQRTPLHESHSVTFDFLQITIVLLFFSFHLLFNFNIFIHRATHKTSSSSRRPDYVPVLNDECENNKNNTVLIDM